MNKVYTEHKIPLRGHQINYVEMGKGDPVILLHNGGGFWQTWIRQVDFLSKRFHVFGIDWPGFGNSSDLTEPLSLQLLTDTLTEFIAVKQLRNVILIGNCIGGTAALNYAITNSDNVKRLLIFNICPGRDIYRNRLAAWLICKLNDFPRVKNRVAEILKYIFTKTPVKNNFPAVLFSDGIQKDDFLYQHYLEKIKEKKQTDSRTNMVFAVHTFTLKELLAGKTPFVNSLFWGADNKVTPLKSHGYAHEKLLHPVHFEIIANGSHLCMYEQPDHVNALIENELNRRL